MKLFCGAVTGCILVVGAVLAVSGNAAAFTVDGNLDDWLSAGQVTGIYNYYDPDVQNPLWGDSWFRPTAAGISYWIEDGPNIGSSGYVGPGYGGQNFDVEAMYAYADTTGLYIAVVTGFDPGGVWSWNGGDPQYRPGDLFLDFGDNGSWDLAIETAGLSVGLQPEAYGGTVGNVYGPSGSSPWYTSPVDYDVGPSEIIHDGDVSTDLGTAVFAYSDKVADADDNLTGGTKPYASGDPADYNPQDHNVIEVFLASSWLTGHGYAAGEDITISSFWTEQCGNDWGGVEPQVTVPQVPEPTGIVMLGCLGAGMLAIKKKVRNMCL